MAVAVRSRTIQEIVWEREDEASRLARRHRLAIYDELLTHLEECNVRLGGEVPVSLRRAIIRAGVPAPRSLRAPELIEAIFERQEHFMIPQLLPQPCPDLIVDLRRRIAV